MATRAGNTSTSLVPVRVPAHVPRRLPALRMGGAMATWLAVVFGVCYIGAPLLLAGLGLSAGALAMFPYSLIGFGGAGLLAMLVAMVIRPKVSLTLAGPRDPVIAATLGGLTSWAIIHNTNVLLMPFAAMTAPHLALFAAANVLEMALLGMMFASFTRSKVVAFTLGALFQVISMWIALSLLPI